MTIRDDTDDDDDDDDGWTGEARSPSFRKNTFPGAFGNNARIAKFEVDAKHH